MGSIIWNTVSGTAIDATEVFFIDPLRAGAATGEAVGSGASAGTVVLAVVQDTGVSLRLQQAPAPPSRL